MADTDNAKRIDTNSPLYKIVDQALQAYNAAMVSGDEKRKREAPTDLVKALLESGALDNIVQMSADLQKAAPNLMVKLANLRQTLRDKANIEQVDLKKSVRASERTLLEKEAKDLFDIAKKAHEPTVGMMGSFKALAYLVQGLLGIDVSDFIKFCDEKIEVEKAKIPKMDLARLEKANTEIDTTKENRGISDETKRAIEEIAQYAPTIAEQTLKMTGGLEKGVVKGTTAPANAARGKPAAAAPKGNATTADIETTRAISAIRDGLGINTKVDLGKLVDLAAKKDGKPESLSAKDLTVLENKISMGMVALGEADTRADAAAKAHKIVEQIRAKALASAPAPTPS